MGQQSYCSLHIIVTYSPVVSKGEEKLSTFLCHLENSISLYSCHSEISGSVASFSPNQRLKKEIRGGMKETRQRPFGTTDF